LQRQRRIGFHRCDITDETLTFGQRFNETMIDIVETFTE